MNNIEKYFTGEKLQCTIGMVVSLIIITVSIYFLFLQKPLMRGLAYSILPLSFFLLAICIGIVIRTPYDLKRVTAFYQSDTQKILAQELPRMEKVVKNFTLIKKVEIGVFIAGTLLMLFFWKNELVRGIALGLMTQAIMLYVFDSGAESRGLVYLGFLKSL